MTPFTRYLNEMSFTPDKELSGYSQDEFTHHPKDLAFSRRSVLVQQDYTLYRLTGHLNIAPVLLMFNAKSYIYHLGSSCLCQRQILLFQPWRPIRTIQL